MKTDSLFYRLFKTRPSLLFDLAGWSIPQAEHYSFKSVEVKETVFRFDGIFFPPEQSESPLFFAEVQFQPDDRFYSRLFSEIFLYLRHFETDWSWLAVVIFANRKIDNGRTEHYRELLDSTRVRKVYLEEITASDSGSVMARLVRLMIAPNERVIAQAKRLIDQLRNDGPDIHDRWQLMDIVETIIVYKLPTLSREEIQKMTGLTDIDLKETRFYKDVFSEGKLEGKLEGKQEGMLEGKREGKHEGKKEGEAAVIMRLLNRKLGALDANAESRIKQLPTAKMESLAEALLDFTERADFETWLRQHENGGS